MLSKRHKEPGRRKTQHFRTYFCILLFSLILRVERAPEATAHSSLITQVSFRGKNRNIHTDRNFHPQLTKLNVCQLENMFGLSHNIQTNRLLVFTFAISCLDVHSQSSRYSQQRGQRRDARRAGCPVCRVPAKTPSTVDR